MNRRPATALLVLAALPAVARGEDWPPLPADTWTLKEDPAKGLKGAVVLEERIRVERFGVTYFYRVRVLSEAGKAAAEFNAFPSGVTNLQGRTVYPDGKVLPYNTSKDFQRKTAIALGDTKAERVKVVPPGVTADCVVDLKWTVPQNFVDPGFSSFQPSQRWRLINPYLTRKLVFELPSQFPLSWNLEQYPGQEAVASEKSGFKVFTWTDLAAEEDVPYTLTQSRRAPAVSLYDTPDSLRFAASQGPAEFWNAYARDWLKLYFEDGIGKGGDYRDFLKSISEGLPATPQALAVELVTRLDARLQNYGALSFEERAALGKKAEESIDPRDLKGTVRRKGTTPIGMTLLLHHLLKDLGQKPRLLMVVDRDARLFNYQMKDHQQFSDILIGVPEEGKPLLIVDPGLRYGTPGLVLPDYQGVPALEVDATAWTARAVSIPIQPAVFNQRRYTVALDLQEDEDLFTLQGDFAGFPEWNERLQFRRLEPTERQRTLKERLEGISKAYTIGKAEVFNTGNPKENVGWRVEGRIERAPGRRREVLPFPGVPSALEIPADLPAERKENIVLPYARVLLAKSTFKVPKGYVLAPVQPFQQRNGYGRVAWSPEVKEEGGVQTVTVVMRVDVDVAMGRPTSYGLFKEFLGWIREAGQRTLVLEKP